VRVAEDLITTSVPGATRRISYEPGLDGLRAIAVLATFLVHANVGAPGGFLGVSSFFTLSGFLITAVLVSEHRTRGQIRLGNFWQRRVRRLMPAALLTVTIVAVATLWFGDATQNQNLFGDVLGTLAYVANWHFLLAGTTYAGEYSGQSPLLHFWSLAIEEQFYLVYPLVMVAALSAAARWRRAVPAVLLLGIAWSLVAGIVASGSATSIDKLYFRTDIRAGELLVGALFGYWWVTRSHDPGEPARRVIRWLGAGMFALMLGLIVVADHHDLIWYQGGLVAYSLVTVSVILAAVEPHGVVRRVLGCKPLVWVGVVSYGAYLVHWPLFMWLHSHTDLPGMLRLAVGTAATLAIAYLSFRSVELPVRERRRFSVRWLVVLGLGLMITALVIGKLAPTVARNTEVPKYLQQRDLADVELIEANALSSGTGAEVSASRPRRILLLGDSVAASLATALGEALGRQGVAFANSALPGCGVLAGDPADEDGHPIDFTAACGARIPPTQRRLVERIRPDLVVVFSSWEKTDRVVDGQWAPYGSAESDARLLDLYSDMVDRLTERGARVALTTIPDPVDSRRGPVDERMLQRTGHLNELLVEVARRDPERVSLVRLDEIICPSDPCPEQVDGIALRPRDGTHFDDPAAASLVAERWVALLMQIRSGEP